MRRKIGLVAAAFIAAIVGVQFLKAGLALM